MGFFWTLWGIVQVCTRAHRPTHTDACTSAYFLMWWPELMWPVVVLPLLCPVLQPRYSICHCVFLRGRPSRPQHGFHAGVWTLWDRRRDDLRGGKGSQQRTS